MLTFTPPAFIILSCKGNLLVVNNYAEVSFMCTFKKVLKIIGIVMAVAGAIAGIYFAVTKIMEKKNCCDGEENYVSCSCFDDEQEPVVAAE